MILGKLSREGEKPKADHDALVEQMIGAFQQIILRAHAHGLKVYGATILPDGDSGYYHPAPANEADRVAVQSMDASAWPLRRSHRFRQTDRRPSPS